MPYIIKEIRSSIERGSEPVNPGELNFKITSIIDNYITKHGGVNYQTINDVIGVLECAKLELYRKVVALYEDKKCKENGEVYTVK